MKRLLFVIPYLTTGGTNRSLQCLLSFIDAGQYEVDIYVLAKGGVYTNLFPNSKLLPVDKYVDSIIAHLDTRKGFERYLSVLTKVMCKLTDYKFQRYIFKRTAKRLKANNYDAIIAYSEGVATEFVSHIVHPNKIAWIHCDYASYHDMNGTKDETDVYRSYKSVVCVSQFTRRSFLKFYPQLESRTFAIPNLIDSAMMVEKSAELTVTDFDKNYFNIVSVGRIDPVKQMSAIPEIASRIHKDNPTMRWYIIGPKGSEAEYNRLIDNIRLYECEDYVILAGEKANPYPYIKQADMLVVPSKSEACPYVVNEAKVLGTPVVTTDFGSASEFIEDGITGRITTLKDLHTIINQFINDEALTTKIRNNLSSFTYDNESLLKSIYERLDGKDY